MGVKLERLLLPASHFCLRLVAQGYISHYQHNRPGMNLNEIVRGHGEVWEMQESGFDKEVECLGKDANLSSALILVLFFKQAIQSPTMLL